MSSQQKVHMAAKTICNLKQQHSLAYKFYREDFEDLLEKAIETELQKYQQKTEEMRQAWISTLVRKQNMTPEAANIHFYNRFSRYM